MLCTHTHTRSNFNRLNEKGITLIALIVTIIVLLILAGVSISMLTGEDGIIAQAVKSKEASEIANEKEIVTLAVGEAKIETKMGKITIGDMENVIDENIAEVINNGDTIAIKFKESGRYYNIEEDGNIEHFTPHFDDTPGELIQNSNDEYMIESIEDLVTLSAMANGGYSDENIEIGTFPQHKTPKVILMCDLDFKSHLSYDNRETTIYNGYLGIEDENVSLIEALTNTEKYNGFVPIGCESIYFSVNFEGNGHYIKNLYENIDDFAGLFGNISDSNIENITVTGNIISTNHAGVLIGEMHRCNLTNIIVKGNVKSDSYAGGLIGRSVNQSGNILISNCLNYANIYGNSSGGLAGSCDGLASGNGIIINCSNYGSVEAISNSGGMIGEINYSKMTIKNSNNDSEIIGENAGGMVGWSNKAFIYSCHLTPNSIVSGIDNAGGFVGYAYGGAEIYNSMSLGTVRSEIKAGRICRSK